MAIYAMAKSQIGQKYNKLWEIYDQKSIRYSYNLKF